MPTVPALNAAAWERCARQTLAAQRLGDHQAAEHHRGQLARFGHRAEQVALLVWADAMLEACGLPTGRSGRAARLAVYDIAPTPGDQHPAIEWLLRLLVAHAAGERDATARVIREAELDPQRWPEYLDQALRAAALTVQLEPAARIHRAPAAATR